MHRKDGGELSYSMGELVFFILQVHLGNDVRSLICPLTGTNTV